MKTVDLMTTDGNFVVTAILPPFMDDRMPDVLVWGSRTFQKSVDGKYYECFAYYVVNTA